MLNIICSLLVAIVIVNARMHACTTHARTRTHKRTRTLSLRTCTLPYIYLRVLMHTFLRSHSKTSRFTARLAVFPLCLYVALLRMTSSQRGDSMWMNPCADRSHHVTRPGTSDVDNMAAADWLTGEQLMPLARDLALALADTTEAVGSAATHVRWL